MSSNLSPRDAALLAAAKIVPAPTGRVAYNSQGRVAVVGAAGTVADFCAGLSELLQSHRVIVTPGKTPRAGLHLDGHLGNYRLTLGKDGALLAEADMVIDLLDDGDVPLLGMSLSPFGYLVGDADPAHWSVLREQAAELVGQFEKPRFFNYNPDICAHGRSGMAACNRCVEACPAEAITALAERVSVDPYLCQGGGICATVCPTGAMTFAYPDATTTLDRLRVMITAYIDQAGAPPVLLLGDVTTLDALQDRLPSHWLGMPQEELASVGSEVWLSALAYGAVAVVLAEPENLSTQVQMALFAQSQVANVLLASMGYPEAVVHWSGGDLPQLAALPSRSAATYAGMSDKRQTLYMALDHLYSMAPVRPQVSLLPANAPFGHIEVNKDRCTLCMACASVCPAKALSAGGDTPRLDFHEANCVQCGLCQQACPESAIRLEARFLHDPEQRRARRILNEEPPFCCVSCGAAFATHKVIERMLEKLSGHWMYTDEAALNRLKMCQDCRVIDMMKDSA